MDLAIWYAVGSQRDMVVLRGSKTAQVIVLNAWILTA
jgi:hypothetical protein